MPVNRAPSPLRNRFLFVFGLMCLGLGTAVADDAPLTNNDLPAVFSKRVPEGLKDLLAIQTHQVGLMLRLVLLELLDRQRELL